MMKRQRSGGIRYSSDRIMVLTATDLPEPVVPAISRCGMRARSTATGLPPMSLPSAMVSRSEEHTSELQSLMRSSYAVFCLKKKNTTNRKTTENQNNEQRQHVNT